jgi:hypothetical protein
VQEGSPYERSLRSPPIMKVALSSQKAEGKKACRVSFLTFFNWIAISATLH